MSIFIRKAVLGDCEHIFNIEQEVTFDPWSEESIRQELELVFARYFVAIMWGDVCGFAGQWLIHGEAQVTTIAVAKNRQRQGVGKRLLNSLIMSAIDNNCSNIQLEVRESNVAAINLYQARGFTVQGIRPGYYSKPSENAILMELLLNSNNGGKGYIGSNTGY